MKTLFLTLALVVFSVSITAQDYTRVSNTSLKTEPSTAHIYPPSKFTTDVMAKERFKYRDFVSKSRKSDENFQIGQKIYTKKQLAQLLRKKARKSVNQNQFIQFMIDENPQFASYFSNEEMVSLYQKFREGTFNKYVNDLASDFR